VICLPEVLGPTTVRIAFPEMLERHPEPCSELSTGFLDPRRVPNGVGFQVGGSQIP